MTPKADSFAYSHWTLSKWWKSTGHRLLPIVDLAYSLQPISTCRYDATSGSFFCLFQHGHGSIFWSDVPSWYILGLNRGQWQQLVSWLHSITCIHNLLHKITVVINSCVVWVIIYECQYLVSLDNRARSGWEKTMKLHEMMQCHSDSRKWRSFFGIAWP